MVSKYRADTISILKISKGNNSEKNIGGVTVVVTVVNLCTSSDHGLYLCQVSWNYLERYQSYGADTNVQLLTDGPTDTQKFRGYNIIPRHFFGGAYKDEIRAYIQAHSKLGCSLKQLMTEISTACGPSGVSYDTVPRWKTKFESGVESIKNAPKSGRPKSAFV